MCSDRKQNKFFLPCIIHANYFQTLDRVYLPQIANAATDTPAVCVGVCICMRLCGDAASDSTQNSLGSPVPSVITVQSPSFFVYVRS